MVIFILRVVRLKQENSLALKYKKKTQNIFLYLSRKGGLRVITGNFNSVIKTETRSGIPAMPLTRFWDPA